MKQVLYGAVFAVLLIFSIEIAFAHSPNALSGYYDLGRQQLNVTVQHLVNDPGEHYIREVVIYKNGSEAARMSFDFQTSRRNQTMPPIKVPAVIGDVFKVIAECSVSGSAEAEIEVTDAAPSPRRLN